MVYVVMGVAGSGKTTVGKILAEKLGLPFYDGDDYHSTENLAKMRQGTPLSDQDREPWLAALAREIARWNRGGGAVLACSALRGRYRSVLSGNGAEEVIFVHLHGSPELLKSRLQSRLGHFFNPRLLPSQLQELEIPDEAIAVDIDAPAGEIAARIVQEISARGLGQ